MIIEIGDFEHDLSEVAKMLVEEIRHEGECAYVLRDDQAADLLTGWLIDAYRCGRKIEEGKRGA